MSQSPVDSNEIKSASLPDSDFRDGLRRLNKLIRDGGTLSGFEKNCVFLNVPGKRFATISAVSGLDFPDDARSHALVDWDHDGDVDLWTANRTAPMVRYLRNDTPKESRSLSLRLQGVECNRDAIGAKVEVILSDANQKRLVKTLRAGEGFLGQSSKWLHFGLGRSDQIQQVIVRWPRGNKHEVFQNISANGRYYLIQGIGLAQAEPPRKPVTAIAKDTPNKTVTFEQSAVLLSSRVPLPKLAYRRFDQQVVNIQLASGRLLLINIWADWCLPCAAELKDLAVHAERLKAAGLDVLALAANSEENDNSLGDDKARRLISKLQFPYSSGVATTKTLNRLQTLYDLPFGSHRPLPVPTSFLITGDGQLAAVYRGPVNIDRLLEDIDSLALAGLELREKSLPFAGLWYSVPQAPAPIAIALDLLEKGDVYDSLDYVRSNRDLLRSHKEYTKLLTWIGERLFAADETETATEQFEEVLRLEPNNLTAINNLAWQLATHAKMTKKDRIRAIQWAEKGARLTEFKNLTLLDTLAAAYASDGQFERAVAVINRALLVAKAGGQPQRLQNLNQLLDHYKKGLPHP